MVTQTLGLDGILYPTEEYIRGYKDGREIALKEMRKKIEAMIKHEHSFTSTSTVDFKIEI